MKKFFYLLLAFGLASSCVFEKPLHFKEITITQENFEQCKTNTCPTIKVQYIQAIEDDEKSAIINKYIQQELSDKIATPDDDSLQVSTVEEALMIFINDFLQFKEDFGNHLFSNEIDTFMNVSYQSEDFVSLKLSYYSFTGGAHGYSGTSYLNFDAITGLPLNKNQLFTNTKGMLSYCEQKFREAYQISENRSINSSGFWFEKEQFHLPENIGFTENNIILHYNQYEIASYAEGPIILSIPLNEVEQFL